MRTLEPTDAELRAIIRLVYERSGIALGENKRALVATRLQGRIRQLGLSSYGEYVKLVESDSAGDELIRFVDAMTTNHTWFFRESQHFDLLTTRVAAEMAGVWRSRGVRGWCAASSTGEEPYTIVMSLLEALPQLTPSAVQLLASDISTKALRAASAGVYPMERLEGVPPPLVKRYFEKGLGESSGQVRVSREVRRSVVYRRLNLLEITDLGTRFDFIFCRNVMIYFDKSVQQKVVAMLERHIAPGGYLFVSHSEGLTGVLHGLKSVAPAVYQRRAA